MKLIESHPDLKVNTDAIHDAWGQLSPSVTHSNLQKLIQTTGGSIEEKPTARAIKERLFKLKSVVNAKQPGKSNTPSKASSSTSTPHNKRSRPAASTTTPRARGSASKTKAQGSSSKKRRLGDSGSEDESSSGVKAIPFRELESLRDSLSCNGAGEDMSTGLHGSALGDRPKRSASIVAGSRVSGLIKDEESDSDDIHRRFLSREIKEELDAMEDGNFVGDAGEHQAGTIPTLWFP